VQAVTRSADDIFSELENDLSGILFNGYMARATDGGMLLRLMKIDEKRMKEKLARAKEELVAKAKEEIAKAKEQPKAANGINQPQPPRKA
jgi:hypothetical protein